MIVVDVNVLVYLHLPGEMTKLSEQVFGRDSEWVAPLLWRSEFRNVLAGYLRKDLLPFKKAIDILSNVEKQMASNEFHVPSLSVMNLVKESGCTAYDCEYVVLAQDLEVSLVTADKKIISSFPDVAIALTEFVR